MADPAVEATNQAWEDFPVPSDDVAPYLREVPLAAAREALKPIRELIEEARTWKPYDTRDIGEAYLADTVNDLLDDIAKLIYTTEEIQ